MVRPSPKGELETPAILTARDLSKSFGQAQVVSQLNFELRIGEIVGLLGENGAGKTTTFRMLAGIVAPSQGSIHFRGYDLQEAPRSLFREIGYLPENAQLYTEMTPKEYLFFRAELKGLSRRERSQALERVISVTGINAMTNRRIGQLSKGYRQRVALADALLASPKLLLLDEPTAGLDPNQVLEFRALLEQLRSDHALLISTHILEEVEATCEQALILSKGKLMAKGLLASLRAKGTAQKVTITSKHGAQKKEHVILLHELDDTLRQLQDAGQIIVSVVEEKSALHQVFRRLTSGESSL